MIDLNHFKEVNDEYGQQAGDCVLREVAQRIVKVARTQGAVVGRADAKNPTAGRPGGDEFVVLLPGSSAAVAQVVADRIRQSLVEPIAISPDLKLRS